MDGKYKKIDSLEYGLVLSTGIMALFYCMLAILVAVIIVLIIVAVFEPDSVPYVITVSIFAFLTIIIGLSIIIVNHKRRSKIKLWVKNAVLMKAISNAINSYTYNLCIFIPVKATKLQISFNYNNQLYVKTSGKERPGELPQQSKNGYSWVFTKYANREIPILYSPKYDQVLLLKEKTIKEGAQ